MSNYLSRIVTHTKVKCAKTEIKDGKPVAVPMDDLLLIGNYSLEKAQKEISKECGENVVVVSVQANTLKYEMPVEDFVRLATPVIEGDQGESSKG